MTKFSKLLFLFVSISSIAFAQTSNKTVPKNWHLMDYTSTGFNGISIDKAYQFIKEKKLKSNTVVVAVIDSGIDTLQEDLKDILWTNPKEIPHNGEDDDKNGYIDDVHGWNFIGGKNGKSVSVDSYEAARVYHSLKNKWANSDGVGLTGKDKSSFEEYKRAKQKIIGSTNIEEEAQLKPIYESLKEGDSMLRKELGKEEYTGEDLKNFSPEDMKAKITYATIMAISAGNNSYDISNKQLLGELSGEIRKINAAKTPPPTYRKDVVGDDESDINDIHYGNNDIMATDPFHGTHCSGIIGAIRKNGKGIDGVADNVRIMPIRAVPDGDEHDKDIANAIRYAVNNGAKVISMSFGKDFSPEKHWVDDAFKYAESKGVLLVHAAGNDHANIDTVHNFPNPVFVDGKGRAKNVITVGASGDLGNGGFTAKFSNYGKSEVDLFAPGVNIYSTVPGGDKYGNASGTSMACPVVSGVAALIMEYFPKLSAIQVKEAIEKSVRKSKESVKIPGTDKLVSLSEISKTGGFLDAYAAVKYARAISSGKTVTNKIPKSKVNTTKKG